MMSRMPEIRINVIGASGSGTSTVGRSLAAALSLPHFESDAYYHAPSDPPFQNPRSPVERYELVLHDLAQHESWILSGGIGGWQPQPELRFTSIVFLYVPTLVRIERLRRRELARFGQRICNDGDMFEAHEDFIRWASRYDTGDIEGKTLARHEAYLSEQQCQVLEFRGEFAVSEITAQVLRSRPGERRQ
jgi:adenylate kinase family enzyme